MGTTLVICLLIFARLLHAGSIGLSSNSTSTASSTTTTSASETITVDANGTMTSSSLFDFDANETMSSSHIDFDGNETTTSSFFDFDAELAKIAATCMTSADYEQLWGNIIRHGIAVGLGRTLMREAVVIIGLTELRAALNFAPLPKWTKRNSTKPSESELVSAPKIEAYFDLKEPRSSMRSLDSIFFFEHNFPPAIAYLDKRFPAIRTSFRRRFEEIRRIDQGVVVHRKTIDSMLDEFHAIRGRVEGATEQMHRRSYECWDE